VSSVALAFLAGALGAAGLGLAVPLEGAGGRWRSFRASRGRAPGGTRLVRMLGRLGGRLGPAAWARAPTDLAARVAAAGLGASVGPTGARLDARDIMAAKLAAAALAATAGTLIGAAAPGRLGAAVIVAAPVAGFIAPDVWLARRARQRARRVRTELPGMLDLLRVTVEAGLSLTAALAAVGTRTRGELGTEWRVVSRQVELGVPTEQALAAMAVRLPIPEVAALIAALERAIRHGAPLAETLAAQARDARAGRQRRIREEAAQASPKIQLVVALLLVPSVLLLVAAALASALVGGGGAVTFV